MKILKAAELMIKFTFISLFLCIKICLATDFEKTWIPNTNFENVNNWKDKHLPCSEDRILFPEVSPEISISKSHIFTDITLPQTGEFKLQGDISLKFSAQSTSDSECIGRDASYIRSKPKIWLNPDNWCLKKNGECSKSVVQAELIPSQYDTVIFPPQSSYYVEIDKEIHIEISSANIKGKLFRSSRNLRQFLSSTEGRREFTLSGSQRAPTISLSAKQCRDPSGCVFNTLNMMKSICRHVQCADQLSCKKTVRPKGACCDVCDATVITIVPAYNFQLSSVRTVIRQTINKQEKWSLMKISSSQIQLVLWSDSKDKIGPAITLKLYSKLKSESKELNIKDIRMSSSHSLYQGRHGTTALSVILVLLFLGGLAVGIFYGYQKYKTGELSLARVESVFRHLRPRSTLFNRTANRHSRLQEPTFSASVEKRFNDDIELPSAVAFDNPIFEGIPLEEGKKSDKGKEMDDDPVETIPIDNVSAGGKSEA